MQQITGLCVTSLSRTAAFAQTYGGAIQHALSHNPGALQEHLQQWPAWRQQRQCTLHSQAAQGPCWPQKHPRQQHTTPALTQQPHRALQLHPQQHPRLQQLQLRPYSVDSEVSRQRLIAAQQRRAREQEALQRRKAAEAAALGAEASNISSSSSSSSSSTELQDHAGSSVAVVPQESPPADVQVAAVFNHPALVVTRSIEWGTLILGFEQATKYTVYDQDGTAVALIAEEISGIGNEIQRQVLRTRRSFTSTVLSADGSQVLFRVRRPAYLINSYMYIEDPQGDVIGEVRQRWHLWRRKYDLFMGKRQFAAIDGGLLAWEFELKDGSGNTLALIDRNFLGFAKEIFTDAGKYVVHFGYKPTTAAAMAEKTLAIRSGQADVHVTPLAQLRTEVAVIPSVTGNQLVVTHPLPLDERMIALAAAISVDYNFFSPHSRTSGLLSPPIFMPLPGGGGAGGAAAGGAEGAAGGAAAGAAGAEAGAATEAGGAASTMEPPPGFSEPSDAGFSSGFGAQGSTGGFGDDAESFKWDDVAGGIGGAAGGDEESSSGLWGILVGIWAMIVGE